MKLFMFLLFFSSINGFNVKNSAPRTVIVKKNLINFKFLKYSSKWLSKLQTTPKLKCGLCVLCNDRPTFNIYCEECIIPFRD